MHSFDELKLDPAVKAVIAHTGITTPTPIQAQAIPFLLEGRDVMLDRGFAPDVERILGQTPRERQTALFSATVPEWVMTTARKHLTNPAVARVDREVDGPPEIEHVIYDVGGPDQKLTALRTL